MTHFSRSFSGHYRFFNQISLFSFLRFLFLIFFSFNNIALASPTTVSKTIAITQIVRHESLDSVVQGIVDELAASGYQDKKTARVILENAQGNIVLAAQIAQRFVAEHPDVMIAIATPSAQTLVNAAKKTNIPIVFASITDPLQAKLVNDLKHPGGNVTGTRNVAPIDKQIALIKQLLPQVKTIGLVINYGEANSVQMLKTVKEQASRLNIKVKVATAANSSEVQMATNSLVKQVDAFFLLQDNTVASALPTLLKIADQNKIPVFSTYISAVKKGALAGIALDEYVIGKQTGKIVVKILKGEKPGDIPVEDPNKIDFAINVDTAKKLNLKIGEPLLKQARLLHLHAH